MGLRLTEEINKVLKNLFIFSIKLYIPKEKHD